MRISLTVGVLRSWRIDDAAALVEAANNRNVSMNLRDMFPHPYTRADAEGYLAVAAVGEQAERRFCIEVDGRAVGGIGLHPQADVNRLTAELGYWLAEPFWGRGIMSGAVPAMVAHGFKTLPLERIEAFVFANNPASARVLEKCGFTLEGRMRRNVIKDGQVLDSLVYSILREEIAASPSTGTGA